MTTPSEVRCVTPQCVEVIAKYGEHYHRVYDRDNRGKDATQTCEGCGARRIGGAWQSTCKKCGKAVDAGALTGLFVPHLCAECLNQARENDRRRGAICRMCGSAYVDCCC